MFLRRPSSVTLASLFLSSSLLGALGCSATGENPGSSISSGSGSPGSGAGATGGGTGSTGSGTGSTGSTGSGTGSTGSTGVIVEMPDGSSGCGAALPA